MSNNKRINPEIILLIYIKVFKYKIIQRNMGAEYPFTQAEILHWVDEVISQDLEEAQEVRAVNTDNSVAYSLNKNMEERRPPKTLGFWISKDFYRVIRDVGGNVIVISPQGEIYDCGRSEKEVIRSIERLAESRGKNIDDVIIVA